jgi:hypothetical protein
MPAHNPMFGSSIGVGESAPMSSYAQTPTVPEAGHLGLGANVSAMDGTPMRVVTIMILAVVGLAGLKWAGYRFNVTSG